MKPNRLVLCLFFAAPISQPIFACALSEGHGTADKLKWEEYKKQRRTKTPQGKVRAQSFGETPSKIETESSQDPSKKQLSKDVGGEG